MAVEHEIAATAASAARSRSSPSSDSSVQPAQHRGPAARSARRVGLRGSRVQCVAGLGVVLDVVAVVEEQQVVQQAVVADRAAGVLVVAVQPAQAQAQRRSRAGRPSGRSAVCQASQRTPTGPAPAATSTRSCRSRRQPPGDAGVVGQVPAAPDRLRDAEQHAQVEGEQRVQRPRAEERPVDEVVGDGVGVPPQPHGDDGSVGTASSRAPCADARATSRASHGECRRRPGRGRRSVAVLMAAIPSPRCPCLCPFDPWAVWPAAAVSAPCRCWAGPW